MCAYFRMKSGVYDAVGFLTPLGVEYDDIQPLKGLYFSHYGQPRIASGATHIQALSGLGKRKKLAHFS
jgi:hypothetical protein